MLQDLAPSLSVPPLEDPPPDSMESFVMCGPGEGSKMPVVLELKNLVGQLKDVTLGTSLAESSESSLSMCVCVSVLCVCVCMRGVLCVHVCDVTVYGTAVNIPSDSSMLIKVTSE